ncbi:hypothetical protein YQE_03355, partial [Dendroctonus ponderosae]
MHTTPQKAGQVIALIENGLSHRTVARQVDMTRVAVRRVCKRYEETGSFHRLPVTGRKRFTTARDDRFIVSTTLRNRHHNSLKCNDSSVKYAEWLLIAALKSGVLMEVVPVLSGVQFLFTEEELQLLLDISRRF